MPFTAALVGGGLSLLGGAMQGDAARSAARTSADAQLRAAQIAADASALAAIYGGATEAEVVAWRNGATLLRLQADGNSVQTVQVCVGRQSATASARDSWVGDLPTMTP